LLSVWYEFDVADQLGGVPTGLSSRCTLPKFALQRRLRQARKDELSLLG
jgi:hypothetical protein